MKILGVVFLVSILSLSGIVCGFADTVSSWNFNGNLNDTAGTSQDSFSEFQGQVRYLSETELPGVDGEAVALGVNKEDTRSLTAVDSADVRLGPDYTIEAWVLPSTVNNGWHRFVLNWGAIHSYHFAIHDGAVSLYHCQSSGEERFAEGGKVTINRWNHIVGVARRNEKEPANSRLEVYLNGRLEASAIYDGTIRTSDKESLTVGSSEIGYQGYIDSVTIWNEALSAEEISKRTAERQKAIDLPSPEISRFKNTLKNKDPLEIAVILEKGARNNGMDDEITQIAAELLDHDDLFVRAMAEWAIARKVGRDNNHEEVLWNEQNDVEWFQRWLKISVNERVEMDWCRQAVSMGIYNDALKLKASVDDVISRTIKMGGAGERVDGLRLIRSSMDNAEDLSVLRGLWIDVRRMNRNFVFEKADFNFDEVILYKRYGFHYKPNVCGVHTSWSYKPGGEIVVVSGLNEHRNEKAFIDGRLGPGHVHGVDLSFDGKKVVFSWAQQPEWPPRFSTRWPRGNNDCYAFELRNTTIPPHLYEMDLESGMITQLTDHNFWSDIEPMYCPDGTIAFTSDRSAHSPSCDAPGNDLTDHNLYSLSADRKRIRRLTNQKDVDMHPHLLDNGLIAYLRWEYQERHFWDVHSVWTVKPDGTMSDAVFKQHLGAPLSVRDARSIPGTSKLVAIAAGHHCLPMGPVVILDPTKGINAQEGIHILTQGSIPQEGVKGGWKETWNKQVVADGGVKVAGGFFMMPYAVSEKAFLVSYGYGNREARRYNHFASDLDSNGLGIYLIDSYGNMELIYRQPLYSSYGVLPFSKRKKPVVLPDAVDVTKNYAVCVIPDIYDGMDGVERGVVKYIRIAEALPWPIVPGEGVKRWVPQPIWGRVEGVSRWCPVRVIGTVPVDEDGSAFFKVPTMDNASVYFQALDKNYMEVRRMRSSVSFQPGEMRSCNGCHETNVKAPAEQRGSAVKREPVMPQAPEWGCQKALGYEWLVQPVLDKHCVSCHGGKEPKGNLDFTAGKSYKTISGSAGLVSISNRLGDGGVSKVKEFGSHKSKLILSILNKTKGHEDVKLAENEWIALVTWVDANAPYGDKMLSKRTNDGRKDVWELYQWKDPWAKPEETPAEGDYLVLPDNKWRRELMTK